ncbi:MAG: IPT/TIG domain-containing protein [Puniceicoccales bacterium]|jgi:hypothetical protein|nr:IPT/TIG domain-containing protein [Puniceicoccales bacterium]
MAGCTHVSIRNVTPQVMATNISRVYPLTMNFAARDGKVNTESIRAHVIIDGHSRKMRSVGHNRYVYEYRMTSDNPKVIYSFSVDYSRRCGGKLCFFNEKSPDFELILTGHYAMGLDSQRGIPGAPITIIGRGFQKSDTVYVGDSVAETQFLSPTAIQFRIPQLPSGKHYNVELANPNGTLPAGKIFVDKGNISTNPKAIEIKCGESTILQITISAPAPSGGLEIDVTTNIPDAIVVPDVHIRQGKVTTSLKIEGAEVAHGMLFLSGKEYAETAIPLVIVP